MTCVGSSLMMGDMAAGASGGTPGVPQPTTLGWQIHLKAIHSLSCIKERIEQQYTWIDEALVAAKQTFASPEIQMIPKTPSAKRCRKVVQKIVETDEEDDAFEEAPPKKNSKKREPKGKRLQDKASQEVLGASSEASIDTEPENSEGSARPTRSAKARGAKKPSTSTNRSTRATRRQAQEASDEESEASVPKMSLKKQIEQESPVKKTRFVEKEGPRRSSRRSSRSSSMPNQGSGDGPSAVEEVPTTEVVCIIDSDSDDLPTPQAKRRSIRKDSSPEQATPRQNTESIAPVPEIVLTTSKDTSNSSQNFPKLNVKQRASQYEELVRRSGSREGSPATKLTPKMNRLCVKTLTPQSGKLQSRSPQTPGTIVNKTAVSRATLTLNNSGLGASPRNTVMKVKARLSSSGKRRSSQGTRRSSRRVSGAKLSLSKRRSSIHRYKERKASPVAAAVNAHLMEIKARQLVNSSAASSLSASDDEPANPTTMRSTRSKTRVQKLQATETNKTPERASRGSKLSLKKSSRVGGTSVASSGSDDVVGSDHSTPPRTRSKMRQTKPPQSTMTASSEEDMDTEDGDYRAVEPPSTSAAPIRSTRSKMRQLLQQNSASSPCVATKMSQEERVVAKKAGRVVRSDEGADNCTPPKMDAPVHQHSFLNTLNKKSRATPNNISTTVTSFLQRNTPTKKPTTKEIVEQKRKQLLMKEKMEEDRLQARQNHLQKKAEEQRRKREERQKLVAKRREDQLRKEQEMKKGLNQKLEEKKMMTARLQEEKLREEREKQKQREKKMAEAELRRKQEEETRQQKLQEMEAEQQRLKDMQQRKREYEEQERQKRIAEQRRQQEERSAELERDRRANEERRRQMEEQRAKEEQAARLEREEREKRERADRAKQELQKQLEKQRQKEAELEKQRQIERQRVEEEKKELEKKRQALEEEKQLEKLINSHNNALQTNTSLNQQANTSKAASKLAVTSSADNNLNTTYDASSSKTEQNENVDSYEITPVRKVYKPASADNYNIQELKSDDSTDDEEAPRKKIPAWASGPQLKAAIISQYYRPPDLDKIFDPIEPPDLCKLFVKKKAKFFKRTSSAVWSSPIYLPSGKAHVPDH